MNWPKIIGFLIFAFGLFVLVSFIMTIAQKLTDSASQAAASLNPIAGLTRLWNFLTVGIFNGGKTTPEPSVDRGPFRYAYGWGDPSSVVNNPIYQVPVFGRN